jgi:CRP-like cAMP-binding protein
LFKDLDEKDMTVVINSFEKYEFTKDETVIKEGDDGDYLYVIIYHIILLF